MHIAFRNISFLFYSLLIFGSFSCSETPSSPQKEQVQEAADKDYPLLFVGTYTHKEDHVDGKAEGVYVLKMNPETGDLSAFDTIRGIINPSYLAIHPDKKHWYAVEELADDTAINIGQVAAFRIGDNNKSTLINKVSASGDAPCHISVSPDGRYALVANYVSGNVTVMPILEDGSLGPVGPNARHQRTSPPTFRQEAAYAHMITPGVDSNAWFAVDLGIDKIVHYKMEADGNFNYIGVTGTALQSGPRHLVFHPTLDRCYVLTELIPAIEVFTFESPSTPFTRIQSVSTVQDSVTIGRVYPAAIKIHPNGKFLYASNRGVEGCTVQSIVQYKIDQETGELEMIGVQSTGGLIPRDFTIDPSGKFLFVAHQDSGNIVTFKINTESGLLEETGKVYEVATPVCLVVL